MKFYSNQIDIEDGEMGCTLTFNEDKTDPEIEMRMSTRELINRTQKYILLQRTYPEDDFEEDHYYFEPTNFDKACELKDFVMDLYRTRFEMTLNGDFYHVLFEENDAKFEQLKSALETITNRTGKLTIHSIAD
ncbi:MAG: hypothetical protein ABIX01_08545 [Chitinophagaceae bacterium]